MRQSLFFLFSICLWLSAAAQDTNYCEGLKSYGTIPLDFRISTLNKIEVAKQKDVLKTGNKKDKQKFYELTNFGIDEILKSGQVTFNDSITQYINKVFDVIRAANPEIPESVRLYTVKSPVVNAYTTDQGIIFVNTGLLARLHTEAELAFILCHEVVHYTEHHVRDGFIENVTVQKNQKDYKTTTKVDKNLAIARFSRKMETEADTKGLTYFMNTPYSTHAVNEVFDVLKYAYLAFDTAAFDSSIFFLDQGAIPSKYFKTNLDPINVEEDENDSKQTHPNIAKRRAAANKILSQKDTTRQGVDFFISEKSFHSVQKIAQFDVLKSHINDGNLSQALYLSSVLKQKYPNCPQPEIAVGEILFGTALFANDKSRSEVAGYYKSKQGELQQAYYVLYKMPSKDLTLLAVKYNLDLSKKYPSNKSIEKRLTFLFRDLVYYHNIDTTSFIFDSEMRLQNQKKSTKIARSVSSKYNAKTKDSTTVQPTEKAPFNPNWAFELFIDCNCQEEVSQYWKEGKKSSDNLKYVLGETDNNALNDKSKLERKKLNKTKALYGRSLGIDSIIIVDPNYVVLNETKEDSYQPLKSEKEKIELLEHLPHLAKKTGLHITIFSNNNLDSNQVQKFNDYALLNEWVSERFLFKDRANITSNSQEIQSIIDRYGSKYIAWTGVVNYNYPRSRKLSASLLSLYSIVGIPFGIYYLATPQSETNIYFYLFNIETGNLLMYENIYIPFSDSDINLKARYYDFFNQIKK